MRLAEFLAATQGGKPSDFSPLTAASIREFSFGDHYECRLRSAHLIDKLEIVRFADLEDALSVLATEAKLVSSTSAIQLSFSDLPVTVGRYNLGAEIKKAKERLLLARIIPFGQFLDRSETIQLTGEVVQTIRVAVTTYNLTGSWDAQFLKGNL